MKTLILLTGLSNPESLIEHLPSLRRLSDPSLSGLLCTQSVAECPYPLTFARYAKAWDKRCYIWDFGVDSEPNSIEFPEYFRTIECLIVNLPEKSVDWTGLDGKLSVLLDGLDADGEKCRLLILCVPEQERPFTDELPSGENFVPSEPNLNPNSETPDGSADRKDLSEPAENFTGDNPIADTDTDAEETRPISQELSGQDQPLPFLLCDPDAQSTDNGSDFSDHPIDLDTLCRLLFLGLDSQSLNTVFDPKNQPKKNEKTLLADIFDWIEVICVSLVAVILLMSFVVRRSPVEGSSMYPTLIGHNASAVNNLDPEHGVLKGYDDLLTTNLFYTPKRLDIVIIQEPTQLSEPIVKRIIGLSGDTVRMNFDTWEVYVNGELLDEPYVNKKDVVLSSQQLPTDGNNCWEGRVPDGCIFVLGDNRAISKDSRTFGYIDQRYIIGKVFFRISPLDRFGTVDS